MNKEKAIVRACSSSITVGNTGKTCDTVLGAPAMIIALAPGVTFDDEDLKDPVAWMTTLIHDRKAFPLFGNSTKINEVTNNTSDDTIVTLDDGTQVFVRYGVYNRIFSTIQGGLCYAKALQSFNQSGYGVLEIDSQGRMLALKNSDGSYSGFNNYMYAPSPTFGDFKTPYKNRFQLSYSPTEVINSGVIFENAAPLLSMMGLKDVDFSIQKPATVTDIYINVTSECSGADLVALKGADLANVLNFSLTNKATEDDIPITSVSVLDGYLDIKAILVSGTTVIVKAATPAVWLGNNVEGFDGTQFGGLEVLIP